MTITNKYFFETKEQYFAFRDAWKKAANSGVLNASHFVLYNIIRGRDPAYGFTPFQRMSKIEGMGIINLGYYLAVVKLRNFRRYLTPYYQNCLKEFLAPFGETFTQDDYIKIIESDILTNVIPIYINFGKGRHLLADIKSGKIEKPKTCIELMEYLNTNESQEAA